MGRRAKRPYAFFADLDNRRCDEDHQLGKGNFPGAASFHVRGDRLGAALFTRLLRKWSFRDITAVVAALFVLLMPLVLVQVGRIYTEIPVLICVMAALDAYSRGKTERAAVI